jgi:hypothetical protein
VLSVAIEESLRICDARIGFQGLAVSLLGSKAIAVMAWVCHVAGSLLVTLTMEMHMSACVDLDVGMPAAAWGLVALANPRS